MNRRFILQLSTAIVTTIGAGLFSHAAIAADAAPAAAAGPTANLEEVIVTAERFSGNVQSTPIAVSAFTPTTLEARQITNVLQVASQIPGVVITPATGTNNSARIVLRGAGQEQSGIQFDAAVGVYIDNVYQPRINGSFFDFFDIGQLEVLRGPQGTLYGRNTSGGAIKITTKRPSFQLVYGGDATFGSYNTRDARGYISGPLIDDKLAFSLSAVTRNRDGWTNAPAYGRKVNNKKVNGARAKLLFTPNEKFEVEAAVDVQEDHSDPGIGSPIQLLGLVPPSPLDPAAVPGRDLFRTELFGPISAKADSIGGSINAKYAVSPNLTFNSITGYRNLRATQAESFTLSRNAAGTLSPIGGSYRFQDHFFSQEFNATFEIDKLKGVAGVYYFQEKGTIEDTPLYTSVANLDIRNRGTTAKAVFAQGTYELGAGVALVGGLRYTTEDADFTQNYFNQVFLGRPVGPQSASKSFKATTPKVGVNWQATPDTLFYVSFTKGFKSGGFNNVNPSTNVGTPGIPAGPVPYGAEDVKSYEAGLKFTTSDHHFRVNIAAYRADYAGLQLPVFFPGTTNTFTSNAAGARIQGIELEPTWQVTPEFQIYGNASFSHGEYTSDFNCSLFNTSIVNCRNAKIKGVVPTKSTLGFTYDLPLNIPGKLRMGADWEYSEKYFNNVSNTLPIVQTPSYSLYNAFLAWDSPDGHWTVSLEGKNLADKRFALESLQIASPVSPSVTAYPNDPRMIDVRIKANF